MFANRLTGKSGQIIRSLAVCLLLSGSILLSLSVSDAANRRKFTQSKSAAVQRSGVASGFGSPAVR